MCGEMGENLLLCNVLASFSVLMDEGIDGLVAFRYHRIAAPSPIQGPTKMRKGFP